MGTTFIIEAEKKNDAIGRSMLLPAFDFGDTAIRMVDYHNWLHPEERAYSFELFPSSAELASLMKSYNDRNAATVPIGSVEFALAWFKTMGIDNVKPLNIPRELWHFCDREIAVGKLKDFTGTYMIKDINIIKYEYNQKVDIYPEMLYGSHYHYSLQIREFFLSEWLPDVVSEWRVFVFDGKICDIRCYSGDFWATPDRQYIESIVKEYDNPSYTLDVMVTPKRTEILELHDFFSCGLYGFEDPILPLMWKRAIRNVMERERAIK